MGSLVRMACRKFLRSIMALSHCFCLFDSAAQCRRLLQTNETMVPPPSPLHLTTEVLIQNGSSLSLHCLSILEPLFLLFLSSW